MALFEKESFPPFPSSNINKNCWDFLILWKAPWQKSLDNKSYFYDSRNRFRDLWKVKWLRGDIDWQVKFLSDNWIIIWDRMKQFYCKDNSSSDDKRNAKIYNDIKWLIDTRKSFWKNNVYPTIILLWTTMKETMNYGSATYVNFIDDGKKYFVEHESEGKNKIKNEEMEKKKILNLSTKEKLLIRGCDWEKNFKPFRLVACNDTSWGCRKNLKDLLKNWGKSWLWCLDL